MTHRSRDTASACLVKGSKHEYAFQSLVPLLTREWTFYYLFHRAALLTLLNFTCDQVQAALRVQPLQNFTASGKLCFTYKTSQLDPLSMARKRRTRASNGSVGSEQDKVRSL